MSLQQRIFESVYRSTPKVSELLWHREEAPPLLQRVVAERNSGTRALDLGCGEGVASTYLASKGYSVVGVDFVRTALDHARARTRAAGVAVEFVEADVTEYAPARGFDVVVDSGCLHHVPASKVPPYESLFSPLRLVAYEETVFKMPFPMGPSALAGVYWFHRS